MANKVSNEIQIKVLEDQLVYTKQLADSKDKIAHLKQEIRQQKARRMKTSVAPLIGFSKALLETMDDAMRFITGVLMGCFRTIDKGICQIERLQKTDIGKNLNCPSFDELVGLNPKKQPKKHKTQQKPKSYSYRTFDDLVRMS